MVEGLHGASLRAVRRIARLIKGFKMDAFAQPQDRSATIGPRFDYLALAPAAGLMLLLNVRMSCRRHDTLISLGRRTEDPL